VHDPQKWEPVFGKEQAQKQKDINIRFGAVAGESPATGAVDANKRPDTT
jgi:hypothetical protein